MTSFFLLLKDDPIWGCIVALTVFLLYIWREQGRIKVELNKVEKGLDDKKLDKEDHETYAKMHKELHTESNRQTNIVLRLLEKVSTGGK